MRPKTSLFFCFCGPSGSGKSTITRALAAEDTSLMLSISTTTRSPRGAEVDGRDYHFLSREAFLERVQRGEFIEHAEFGDNLYGTEKRNIDAAVSKGADLLLDIEVQGVRSMKRLYADRTVTIFVFPPSRKALEERITARATESKQQIAKRLQIAEQEIKTLVEPGFSDYLLINGDLKTGITEAKALILAERSRFSRFSADEIAALTKR